MGIDWLLQKLSQYRDRSAVIWRDTEISYADLLQRVREWQERLRSWGVPQGAVVALEGDYSPNACALLLALVDRGAIAVPLTQSVKNQREEFLEIAEAQFVVSIGEDDQWTHARTGRSVRNPLTRLLVERGDPGLVLFSSGSTGKSKAALHDLVPLLEKFQTQRPAFRTITFLLLDHIGGINTLFHTLANGGTVIVLESRNPDLVCNAIERHRAELLPTSPTFLQLLLLSGAYQNHDLSSLQLITYGTEVMPDSILARLRAAMPQVRLLQTYGLSELGILRAKSESSDSLWVKVGGEGVETKVVNGTLWIRSKSAMLGYLNAPSPFDEEGWMNTQDQVEVKGDYIRILGRQSEIINVGGEKVYPAEVESILLGIPNIEDVAVYGERSPLVGQIVAAEVKLRQPEELASLKRRIREHCSGLCAPYKIPVKITITDRPQFGERFKKKRSTASGQ